MATVPTFDTFTPGEVVTAAKLNKNVRDAGNFFAAKPVVAVYSNTTQALPPGGAFTPINFDTTVVDTDTFFTIVTRDRVTVKTPGIYRVHGYVGFGASASGYSRGARLTLNNAPVPSGQTLTNPSALGTRRVGVSVSVLLRCAVNDYVRLEGYHDIATTLAVGDNIEFAPRLELEWVAA